MGTIVVSENISVDGVFQDPTATEGIGREDWRSDATDREAWAKVWLDDVLGAEVVLLGRGSYDFFAARHPSRTDALAVRMNSLPKYVVSSTLANPEWNNTTVLGGDVVDEVTKLKDSVDGEIRVYASSQLVRTLLEQDLVDELRLTVFPLLVGRGMHLFDKTTNPTHLRLVEGRTVGDSLTQLTYRRVASR